MNTLRVLAIRAALAGSMACVVAPSHLHAEPAAQQLAANLTVEQTFPIAADAAWKQLGRFCSIADWQSLVASCVIEEQKDGIYRTIVMQDRSVFIERLEEYSSNERAFSYSIKSGPLPITDYRSELRFEPIETGQTKLVWRAWYSVPPGGDAQRIAADLKSLFANGIKGMSGVLATTAR